jgi:hypothetical protein
MNKACWIGTKSSWTPASRQQKRGDRLGKTKRGKGTVVGGCGWLRVPLTCRTESATPAEVTIVEGVLEDVGIGEEPTPLIADRAYDSDKLPKSLLLKGWDLVCPIAEVECNRTLRMVANCVAVAAARSLNAPSRGLAAIAD